MKWIDCKVELPDDDLDVMVALSDGNTVWIGHHDAGRWFVNECVVDVVYWSEMPEHPSTVNFVAQVEAAV